MLLTALSLMPFTRARAQNPTTVVNSNACAVVQNFNSNSGNFTAPSIYSDQYDYEFDYTGAGTNGMFISSAQATLTPYETSLISPIYSNSALDGTATIGFSYSAPAGTLYRIRVIRPNVVSGGADILAITSQGAPIIGGTPNWRQLPAGSGTICLQLNDADLHPGQNLRYEFTFYVTSGSARVTFDNFSLNSIAAAPLPVTFMGIVATQQDNGVSVRWDVSDETDVLQYRLERSTDGASFATVSTVPAQHKAVYGTVDLSAKAPVAYYRIKSVDIDGHFKYSTIIKLVNGNSYVNTIRVYPSPARNQVTVQHSQLGDHACISIVTVDGKLLKRVTPAAGASNTPVDISSLSPGMYVLRLDNGNGKTETATFVKQ